MKIIMPIVSILACFLMLEIGLRAHGWALGSNRGVYPLVPDARLDWRPLEVRMTKKKLHFVGHDPIYYFTDHRGFRGFPTKHNPDKQTLLVIGDSYTQGLDVNQTEIYYESFKEKYNVYAFGAAGYGTYQEYLSLKLFLNDLKPDLVLIQFCSNDIINNSYQLTKLDSQNAVNFDRRFFINNREIRHSELSSKFKLYQMLKFFRSADFFVSNFYKIKARLDSKTLEVKITDGSIDLEFVKKEAVHTIEIFKKIIGLVGLEKIRIFNVSGASPLRDIYDIFTAELGLKKLDEPIIKKLYKTSGIFAKDGSHFNKKGHKILGSGLMLKLQE